MLRSHFTPFALLLLLSPVAAEAQGVYVLDRSSSRVTFRAHALANTVTGRSESLRGLLRLQAGDLRRLYGSVSFPVASLRMGSRSQERELVGLLGAPGEPDITFDIDSVRADTAAGDPWSFFGKLTMRGVARPVRFEGSARTAGARVLASGAAVVDVRQWGITPPSRFLGLVKMSPSVRLAFDAEFALRSERLVSEIGDASREQCATRARSC